MSAYNRHPLPKASKQAIDELYKSISKIKEDYPNAAIMLGGDFNLGDFLWENLSRITQKQEKQASQALLDIIDQYNLEQIVTDPTRKDIISNKCTWSGGHV